MWRPREHPALSRWLAAGRGGRRAGAGRAPSGPPPALPGTSPLPLPPPCPPAGLGYFSTFWSRPRECFHASPLVPADWEPSSRMSHRVSPSVAGHGCDLGLRSGWRVGAPPGAPASDHHPGPCRACGGPPPSLRPPPPSGRENQRCPELPAAAGEGTLAAGEDEKGVCSAPSRLPSPAAPSAPPGRARTPAGGSPGCPHPAGPSSPPSAASAGTLLGREPRDGCRAPRHGEARVSLQGPVAPGGSEPWSAPTTAARHSFPDAGGRRRSGTLPSSRPLTLSVS